MKKLEFIDCETLDDAVNRLIKERENGNHVYLEFNGEKIYSDTVTIESAYQQICGCTKEEFESKQKQGYKDNSKEESKRIVDKMFEVTAENSIRDMKMSKLLFITKDGKFLSYIANDYIEKMSKYSAYCKEEEQENWINSIRNLIYASGEVDDYEIESQLHAYENAGKIMEQIANGKSWEEIGKITHEQGHSGMSISLLGQTMLNYSPEGIDFADKIIGSGSIKLLDSLNKAYKKEKRKVKNKQLVLERTQKN